MGEDRETWRDCCRSSGKRKDREVGTISMALVEAALTASSWASMVCSLGGGGGQHLESCPVHLSGQEAAYVPTWAAPISSPCNLQTKPRNELLSETWLTASLVTRKQQDRLQSPITGNKKNAPASASIFPPGFQPAVIHAAWQKN